jgi:hypothetical protein
MIMKTESLVVITALASVFAAGCASTMGSTMASSAGAAAAAEPSGINGASSAELIAQRKEVESLQAQLRQANSDTTSARDSATAAQSKAEQTALLPPNARAGECYARVLLPAVTHTTSDSIVVKEASERVEVIPAVYEDGSEQVVVKEASKRIEVMPATYETATERMEVTPASKRIVEVPATYRTVTEQVLEHAAYTTWKRGSAASFVGTGVNVLQSHPVGTGEVMCLVEVPAKYQTVTRNVVDQPATGREIDVPATYTTVTRQVTKTPPSTREIEIPAVYKTVSVRKLVKTAEQRRIPIAATNATVTKTIVDSAPTLEWRTAVCDVNMTATNIAAIQRALTKDGYFNGAAGGTLNKGTFDAVNAYARAKGLASGSNFIALEVVKSLGVNL